MASVFPSNTYRLLGSALVVSALLVGACSSDSGESSSGGSSGQATTCDKDTRKDIYTAGLSKQGTAFMVKIVEATPSPPAKLTNAMTFQVLDQGGKPVDGATLSVTPFMPDHGHGSAAKPVITPQGDGKYAVSNIYYPMAGLWRLTITVTMPGASPQDVAFSFCIEG